MRWWRAWFPCPNSNRIRSLLIANWIGVRRYILCAATVCRFSLAACDLAAAGLAEPIVVDGGIEAWERQCLPVTRQRSWHMPVIDAPAAALLAALAFGLGLAFHGFFFFVALFVWNVGCATRF